jgi:peptidoglycan-N-acetylglucosamine deacetylase
VLKSDMGRKVLTEKNKSMPLASLSLDLDNKWSYMKTHGDYRWEKMPNYLDVFIPHVLEILDRYNLKITFFIVGQDAAMDQNKDVLRELTRQGHEVGNHSFHHEVWLHQYPRKKIKQEILLAEDQIFEATGEKAIGYRGPGFTWSHSLFDVLAEIGYTYDASTLPTYLGPLARMYYFWAADLNQEQKHRRESIYGEFRDGLKPIKPYIWQLDSKEKILEIPVTTIPVIKSPFHLSYLIYLSRISEYLMTLYLTIAITLCKLTATEPSFLLHPLDLLGGDRVSELAFFPGMDLSTNYKVHLFEKVIKILSKHFELINLKSHALQILNRPSLPIIRI